MITLDIVSKYTETIQRRDEMSVLKDIAYSKLQQNERAYEVMLLRDQYDNTFTDIAKKYEISVTRALDIYRRLKIEQVCFIRQAHFSRARM